MAIDARPTSAASARAIHPQREQRGFALYVGLSERTANEYGIGLGELVDALKRELQSRFPSAESHALAVVAPIGTVARDLDLVLRATVERPRTQGEPTPSPRAAVRQSGVVVDLARHRMLVDDRDVGLTYKEFALVRALVANDGNTLARDQLREAIATSDEAEVNDRTIDVHIRRLRVKLGNYPDVIRTVHGRGYRFDPRSDVTVLRTSTPSPDLV